MSLGRPIDDENRRSVERRNKKAAGSMAEMVTEENGMRAASSVDLPAKI